MATMTFNIFGKISKASSADLRYVGKIDFEDDEYSVVVGAVLPHAGFPISS